MSELDAICAEEAAARVARGDAVLIDVRDHSAFADAHPEPARGIPIAKLPEHLDELRDGRLVITSCGGGSRGPKAAALLRDNGIDARALAKGLRGWREAGLPVESG